MPSTKLLSRALEQRNPEQFGRYQLLGRIASGGMAEIYVARCGEVTGLQTLLAVKRILPIHADDETFVRLFQREARILLSLQHAGIARVVEVGQEDGHWFLAMELVQGETLSQVNRVFREKGRSWDPDLVAHIGSEVAHALHYAHTVRDSSGRPLEIVHRDVSPQNIMLGFDGSVKVIDFGIARWEAPVGERPASTLRGKMQYVSPEQARSGRLDGRSDIFSLGAVLYELLDGDRLFSRGTTTATLEAVCETECTPIPNVSIELNRTLARALAKDPEQRPRNAAAFGKALVRAMDEARTVGQEEVGALVSSLFPARLRRWRQIQEMAAAGMGFHEVLLPMTGEFSTVPQQFIDKTLLDPGAAAKALATVGAEGEYVSLPREAPPESTHTTGPLWKSKRARTGMAAGLALGLVATVGAAFGPRVLAAPDDLLPKDVRAMAPAAAGPPALPLIPPPAWVNLKMPGGPGPTKASVSRGQSLRLRRAQHVPTAPKTSPRPRPKPVRR